MYFKKEQLDNLGIGGMSDFRLHDLIGKLRSDWFQLESELTELKKAHSASPNAKQVLGDGWRDVAIEIPKPRQRVLVTDGNIVCIAWISPTVKDTWTGWTTIDDEDMNDIKAWRLLPIPPAFT